MGDRGLGDEQSTPGAASIHLGRSADRGRAGGTMPKQGDCTLTNLASVTQGGDPSGAKVEVVISNLTDDEIAENSMTISFHAVAMDNQTQSSAVESFYVAAIAAMGSHT